jgi:predicted DsbA family dithiol-disulfide isomerase
LEEIRLRTARSGLDIILIDLWEGESADAEARRYTEMWDIGATVLLDETAQYARELGIRGVPTNVFVDSDGTVRAVGASTMSELTQQLRALAPQAAHMLAEPIESLDGEVLGPLVEGIRRHAEHG